MFLSPPMWEDLEFPVAKGLMGQVCMRPGLSISSEQKVACRLEHMGKKPVTGAVRLQRFKTNRHMYITGVQMGTANGCSHFLKVFMAPLSHCCLSKIKQ